MPTVVMTGGTSGFGAIAAARLQEQGGADVVVGARGEAPVGDPVLLDLALPLQVVWRLLGTPLG